MEKEKLAIALKFGCFFLSIIITGVLIWFDKDIASSMLVLDTIMARDLYRSTTGKERKEG